MSAPCLEKFDQLSMCLIHLANAIDVLFDMKHFTGRLLLLENFLYTNRSACEVTLWIDPCRLSYSEQDFDDEDAYPTD